MPPPKTSEIWNHFTCAEKKAKCRYCSSYIAYNPHNGTGNLVRHLKRKHVNVPLHRDHLPVNVIPAPNIPESANINIVTLASSSSSTIETGPQVLNQNQPSTSNSIVNYMNSTKPLAAHRSKQIDAQLIKMIVKEYHPISIVEDPEFRKFVHLLSPNYNIPTRKTISNSLIPAVYNELKEEIQAMFKKPGIAVCLTADGWTSQNNQNHFYAITAHFIDGNTQLKNVLLDCIHFTERNTANNIAAMLKNVAFEWDLQNNVTAIVTDNASNIIKAVKIAGWTQVRCTAHSLNLAVNNGLQKDELKNIINKVKSIVEYFKRSTHALAQLQINQQNLNLPMLKLKQDCITRWNSTYDMLTRFYTLKNAVITTLAIENPGLNRITVEEWAIISKLINILKIFHTVTEALCSEKHVTLSKIPIYVSSMMENLKEHTANADQNGEILSNFCNKTKEELISRFGDVETNELIAQATILDPRFKQNGLLSGKNAEKAIADLKAMCAKIKLPGEEIIPTPSPTGVANQGSSVQQNDDQSLIWDKFDLKVKNLVAPQSSTASSIIEVDKYLSEVILDRRQDPLIWWRQRKDVYPRLYKIMLKHLCITATSVPCERIFSKLGQIINEKRSRLKPGKSSKIIFLAHNLK